MVSDTFYYKVSDWALTSACIFNTYIIMLYFKCLMVRIINTCIYTLLLKYKLDIPDGDAVQLLVIIVWGISDLSWCQLSGRTFGRLVELCILCRDLQEVSANQRRKTTNCIGKALELRLKLIKRLGICPIN